MTIKEEWEEDYQRALTNEWEEERRKCLNDPTLTQEGKIVLSRAERLFQQNPETTNPRAADPKLLNLERMQNWNMSDSLFRVVCQTWGRPQLAEKLGSSQVAKDCQVLEWRYGFKWKCTNTDERCIRANSKIYRELVGVHPEVWDKEKTNATTPPITGEAKCCLCLQRKAVVMDHRIPVSMLQIKGLAIPLPKSMHSKEIQDTFQPVCKSCNDRKRAQCRKCLIGRIPSPPTGLTDFDVWHKSWKAAECETCPWCLDRRVLLIKPLDSPMRDPDRGPLIKAPSGFNFGSSGKPTHPELELFGK